MNPYQVMGIIATCTVVFAGVVALLTLHGMPILIAFMCVYLVAVVCMLGMQKRARQTYDGLRYISQKRRHDDELLTADILEDDFEETGKAVNGPAQYYF